MADEQNTLTGKASIRAGSYQGGEFQYTPSQKAAMGPASTPETVAMDVLRDGSYAGAYHHAGGRIDVPADLVETLTSSGFAARADRVAVAEQARNADAAEPAPSTAVKPMGTTSAAELAPKGPAGKPDKPKGKR